jgi:hypothetical protein
VIRLWNRVGVFRVLSVAVLLAGAAGGAALAANRQTQQPRSLTTSAVSDLDEARTIQDLTTERERAGAAARNAQREAQAKADAAASAAAAQAKAADDAAKKATGAPTSKAPPSKPAPPPNPGPIPADCNGYTGNPAIGCKLLLESGAGLDQMPCLFNLWMKESGWNTQSANPSGAFGIPQALPGVKMSAFGADWRTNPATQIRWGLSYIKGRYGTACAAWAHWRSSGWY